MDYNSYIKSDYIKYRDALYASFCSYSKDSVLPELLSVFGTSSVDFINMFSGSTIKIPPITDIEELIKYSVIYTDYKQCEKEDATTAINTILDKHDISKYMLEKVIDMFNQLTKQYKRDKIL